MTYQSVNPYDGRLLHTFAEQSDAQLEAAIAAAAACFEVWRATTFAERSAIVSRAAGLMRERREEFAQPVTLATADLQEGLRAKVEKRPAVFTGR